MCVCLILSPVREDSTSWGITGVFYLSCQAELHLIVELEVNVSKTGGHFLQEGNINLLNINAMQLRTSERLCINEDM